jgi:hypothetical protein
MLCEPHTLAEPVCEVVLEPAVSVGVRVDDGQDVDEPLGDADAEIVPVVERALVAERESVGECVGESVAVDDPQSVAVALADRVGVEQTDGVVDRDCEPVTHALSVADVVTDADGVRDTQAETHALKDADAVVESVVLTLAVDDRERALVLRGLELAVVVVLAQSVGDEDVAPDDETVADCEGAEVPERLPVLDGQRIAVALELVDSVTLTSPDRETVTDPVPPPVAVGAGLADAKAPVADPHPEPETVPESTGVALARDEAEPLADAHIEGVADELTLAVMGTVTVELVDGDDEIESLE